MKTATPLPPLEVGGGGEEEEEEEEKSGSLGEGRERVGAALESRMGDTSLPAAVGGRGTQGLLFPFSPLSPGRSLVFPGGQ